MANGVHNLHNTSVYHLENNPTLFRKQPDAGSPIHPQKPSSSFANDAGNG